MMSTDRAIVPKTVETAAQPIALVPVSLEEMERLDRELTAFKTKFIRAEDWTEFKGRGGEPRKHLNFDRVQAIATFLQFSTALLESHVELRKVPSRRQEDEESVTEWEMDEEPIARVRLRMTALNGRYVEREGTMSGREKAQRIWVYDPQQRKRIVKRDPATQKEVWTVAVDATADHDLLAMAHKRAFALALQDMIGGIKWIQHEAQPEQVPQRSKGKDEEPAGERGGERWQGRGFETADKMLERERQAAADTRAERR